MVSLEKKYSFNVHKIESDFNDIEFEEIGAVYFVSKRSESGKHTRIYIGITKSLPERFTNHDHEDCFIENNANCISIYREEDKDRRQEIEKDLLANYNLPCNDKMN